MNDKSAKFRYMQNLGAMSVKPSNASECQACGKCEPKCPQEIHIISELKNVSREMEGFLYKPLVGMARKFLKIKRR
jgi:hypothetical protein